MKSLIDLNLWGCVRAEEPFSTRASHRYQDAQACQRGGQEAGTSQKLWQPQCHSSPSLLRIPGMPQSPGGKGSRPQVPLLQRRPGLAGSLWILGEWPPMGRQNSGLVSSLLLGHKVRSGTPPVPRHDVLLTQVRWANHSGAESPNTVNQNKPCLL